MLKEKAVKVSGKLMEKFVKKEETKQERSVAFLC